MNRIPLLRLACMGSLIVNTGLVGCRRQPAVSSDHRDATRILLCRKCGGAEEADGDVIQQRYAEGTAGANGLFGCSHCEEIAADLITIDLSYTPFQCPACGRNGPRHAADVVQAARDGEVQRDPTGDLRIRCPKCDAFTCVQASENDDATPGDGS